MMSYGKTVVAAAAFVALSSFGAIDHTMADENFQSHVLLVV